MLLFERGLRVCAVSFCWEKCALFVIFSLCSCLYLNMRISTVVNQMLCSGFRLGVFPWRGYVIKYWDREESSWADRTFNHKLGSSPCKNCVTVKGIWELLSCWPLYVKYFLSCFSHWICSVIINNEKPSFYCGLSCTVCKQCRICIR